MDISSLWFHAVIVESNQTSKSGAAIKETILVQGVQCFAKGSFVENAGLPVAMLHPDAVR